MRVVQKILTYKLFGLELEGFFKLGDSVFTIAVIMSMADFSNAVYTCQPLSRHKRIEQIQKGFYFVELLLTFVLFVKYYIFEVLF